MEAAESLGWLLMALGGTGGMANTIYPTLWGFMAGEPMVSIHCLHHKQMDLLVVFSEKLPGFCLHSSLLLNSDWIALDTLKSHSQQFPPGC